MSRMAQLTCGRCPFHLWHHNCNNFWWVHYYFCKTLFISDSSVSLSICNIYLFIYLKPFCFRHECWTELFLSTPRASAPTLNSPHNKTAADTRTHSVQFNLHSWAEATYCREWSIVITFPCTCVFLLSLLLPSFFCLCKLGQRFSSCMSPWYPELQMPPPHHHHTHTHPNPRLTLW